MMLFLVTVVTLACKATRPLGLLCLLIFTLIHPLKAIGLLVIAGLITVL
jgi:hypothetical protein